MKRSLFIIVLLFTAFLNFAAQSSNINNYVTRYWSSSDGLPGNSISDVLQSDSGYMYFGTYESLVKFDGFDFVTMNRYSDPELSFISARSIFEDSEKNIWIGSNDEGVQKIQKDGTKISYSVSNGLPNNSIRSFAEDKQHNIWIGTAAGIVYLTPEGKIITPKCQNNTNISHVTINQVFSDSAGRIWIITTEEKGIFIYTDNILRPYRELNQFGDFMVSAIAQDLNGNLWIGLGIDGIVKVSNGFVTKIHTESILDYEQTNTIYCDRSGALWFGTDKGLVLYKNGEFSVYDENSSIGRASVNKILEDREGNIWVATDNDGICKISLGKFQMNKMNVPVNAICEDKQGKVWIGADDGLYCLENELPVENELTDYIGNSRVRHLAVTEEGGLLVSCYSKPGQVYYYDGEIYNWTTDDGLSGNKTRVALETSNGDLYVGTTTGLSVISSDGTITNHNVSSDFECEYIMSIYEDYNGDIWIGTDGGGIYILKDGIISRKINTNDGLAGNVVFKIMQDKSGIYWISTGSGISRYDGKSFYNYNSAKGLGSDSIFQMIIDQTNTVWMISNRGISSLSFEEMNNLEALENQQLDAKFYTPNDGLKSSGANSTALSMMDQYGRLWFTMSDGYAIYDPLKPITQNVVPLIQIESVKIDEKEVSDFTQPVVIPAGTKHIEIKYTGLSFTASERNRFTHIMEGFETEYTELTNNRTVTYTNLRPGNYTFKVNVQNGDGIFAELPAQIEFVQLPFFYQRYSFWIIIGLVLATIIFFIFFITRRQYIKRQLMLETKIQMATVELEMAKDDSDRLLKNILPASISERMKGLGGEKTIADSYENVTVLFADIVGFTKTTSRASAELIVKSLNDLISRFDRRAARMGVEKIKTIGDAYMAACGVPEKNPKHSEVMLKFAIGMLKDVAEYNQTAEIKFTIRIGMNSGPVIAGVIGQNKFIYDIWGDTVNVASRMESIAMPGHIRITQSVKDNIETKTIHLKCRMEEADVKGKGMMKTYELPEK